MRRFALGAVMLSSVVMACGGDSPSTPSPPPIPPANLVSQGTLTWDAFGDYQGEAKNIGAGCASNVRGVTRRFRNGTNEPVGVDDWTYDSNVRPNETFIYRGCCLSGLCPGFDTCYYRTEISWDNVRCP